jgi:acyl-coenzyme A synthetase/AMP-(fatty) acid ligase
LPKFDPHAVWAAVQRRRVNVLSVIGDAMARPLLEALAEGDYDTSSLLSLNSTAALFSPAVKEGIAKALPNVFLTEAIGATETGFTGMAFGGAGAEHRGGPTVNPGQDVIVISESGGVCGPGEIGKLARGGNMPIGYYKDPAKTAQMFHEVDGRRYVVAGDWARVEDNGAITLLGRGNTCVNTGGEKVYPEEVEGALKSHPDVFDSLVLGVPDERLGQRVAALVELRPGAGTADDGTAGDGTADDGTADDGTAGDVAAVVAGLQAHVRTQLAGYKVPRTIWLVESIGRTVSGKADYRWAREYAASHEPSIPERTT